METPTEAPHHDGQLCALLDCRLHTNIYTQAACRNTRSLLSPCPKLQNHSTILDTRVHDVCTMLCQDAGLCLCWVVLWQVCDLHAGSALSVSVLLLWGKGSYGWLMSAGLPGTFACCDRGRVGAAPPHKQKCHTTTVCSAKLSPCQKSPSLCHHRAAPLAKSSARSQQKETPRGRAAAASLPPWS